MTVLHVCIMQLCTVCEQHFVAVNKGHINGYHSASPVWWTPFLQPSAGHETARGKCSRPCTLICYIVERICCEHFVTVFCIKSKVCYMLLLLLLMLMMMMMIIIIIIILLLLSYNSYYSYHRNVNGFRVLCF